MIIKTKNATQVSEPLRPTQLVIHLRQLLTLQFYLLGGPREAAARQSAAVPVGGVSGVGNAGHELPLPPSGVYQRG